MFKNVIYVLSALLASTVVMACTNEACNVANELYKQCKYTSTTTAAFQKCICTKKFFVNYERCLSGYVCAWDGNPATLNGPCIKIYCPGTVAGGFDPKRFCPNYPVSTSVPPTLPPYPTATAITGVPVETAVDA